MSWPTGMAMPGLSARPKAFCIPILLVFGVTRIASIKQRVVLFVEGIQFCFASPLPAY